MRILLVSMSSIHVLRWVENLNKSQHEIYWFDILNRGELQTKAKLTQICNWKKRKVRYIKGEYFLSKRVPYIYKFIQPLLETTVQEKLESIINEIAPDVIHSFEMQKCSYPLLNVLSKYPKIKWIYTCWGSDLYFYINFKLHRKKIKKVLARIDYLITDCNRDYLLAKSLKFKGEFLGVFPGGGGYNLKKANKLKRPMIERNIILVKGYETKFGRSINVLKALDELKETLSNYQIVVFGAHKSVVNFIKTNNLKYGIYKRHELSHTEVMELMGKSKIYIGNSIADGMPNTLLEAIVMNAFPIQSNPGNVSKEIIESGINGLIIENPENISEIKAKINEALEYNNENFEKFANVNTKITEKKLSDVVVNQRIINAYSKIFNL